MVLAACVGARVITPARLHALVAPFLAGEERHGQRVLRQVGLQSVSAQAAERQGLGIARVDFGCPWLDLLADNRTGARFLITPVICIRSASPNIEPHITGVCARRTPQCERHSVWVDVIVGPDSREEGRGRGQNGRL